MTSLPSKKAVFETQRKRRGHAFYPPASTGIPEIYAQDGKGHQATVYVHYFLPGTRGDWFITEYDPATGEAFGWAEILPGGGELGYVNLDDLEQLVHFGGKVVERDLDWTPKTLEQAIKDRG